MQDYDSDIDINITAFTSWYNMMELTEFTYNHHTQTYVEC